ncbi:MAG: AAA family ATPase, partial [Actinobacteria bacterium]|nr:AAA family ATPase [Actinomycetota bacterium]
MSVASDREAHLPAEDERRLVTVVFADVVGFTAMGEDLDPEQLKNLIASCFERLAADVTAHGGRVDKIMGDELVAMFGAPLAYGDDAERAVRAALQMLRTASEMASTAQGGSTERPEMQLRIGVNTGEALVGQIRPGEYTAMGDVVNVGSRLKGLADPGTVVVGPMTYEATRSAVSYEPLGHLETRGRRVPVAAWKAIGAVAPPGAPSSRPRTPLVGRDHELSLLKSALAAAAVRRRALLVVLLGEAGVGKSRLAGELATHARQAHGAVVLEGRCVPYGEANPWWPIAEALRQAFDVRSTDSAQESAAKGAAKLAGVLNLPEDHVEIKRMADGLGLLMGDESSLRDVDPARARDEARRALRGLLSGLTRERPALIVLSELHWADPLLLDQLGKLEGLHDLPLVLVATARPELAERWQPPFSNHDVMVVHLGPLSPSDAKALAAALMRDAGDPNVAELLAERSGGNAFFLEELAALFNEQEQGAAAQENLPATLRGILAARLDGLSPEERHLLEDAAVVGRVGELEALEALAQARGDPNGMRAAESLASRDLIELDHPLWSFRSNVLQEVAYETLTKAERARRHARLAAWLTEHRCRLGREDEELENVAHHWSVAATLARGLGPVPGLPEDLTGALAGQVWGWSNEGVADRHVEELNLDRFDRRLSLTLDLARQLIGTPRHLSQHPGGFVLTRDRLDDLVPIEPAAMPDRRVIEWEKDDIEELGFMKVDVLGLGMLGCMRRAFDLLRAHKGIDMGLDDLQEDDPKVYEMIGRADTLGVFQIESRAQMSMLPRMKPKEFYDLV